MRVLIRSSLNTLHKPIVLSIEPVAKYTPSSENITLFTQAKCPERVLMRSPLNTLHNPIVLSEDPDAKYSPSSENTTLYTG